MYGAAQRANRGGEKRSVDSSPGALGSVRPSVCIIRLCTHCTLCRLNEREREEIEREGERDFKVRGINADDEFIQYAQRFSFSFNCDAIIISAGSRMGLPVLESIPTPQRGDETQLKLPTFDAPFPPPTVALELLHR